MRCVGGWAVNTRKDRIGDVVIRDNLGVAPNDDKMRENHLEEIDTHEAFSNDISVPFNWKC